jgi:hypothetical protein
MFMARLPGHERNQLGYRNSSRSHFQRNGKSMPLITKDFSLRLK